MEGEGGCEVSRGEWRPYLPIKSRDASENKKTWNMQAEKRRRHPFKPSAPMNLRCSEIHSPPQLPIITANANELWWHLNTHWTCRDVHKDSQGTLTNQNSVKWQPHACRVCQCRSCVYEFKTQKHHDECVCTAAYSPTRTRTLGFLMFRSTGSNRLQLRPKRMMTDVLPGTPSCTHAHQGPTLPQRR